MTVVNVMIEEVGTFGVFAGVIGAHVGGVVVNVYIDELGAWGVFGGVIGAHVGRWGGTIDVMGGGQMHLLGTTVVVGMVTVIVVCPVTGTDVGTHVGVVTVLGM
jgi:hypothetical protein